MNSYFWQKLLRENYFKVVAAIDLVNKSRVLLPVLLFNMTFVRLRVCRLRTECDCFVWLKCLKYCAQPGFICSTCISICLLCEMVDWLFTGNWFFHQHFFAQIVLCVPFKVACCTKTSCTITVVATVIYAPCMALVSACRKLLLLLVLFYSP